jgi:hypothetical protein
MGLVSACTKEISERGISLTPSPRCVATTGSVHRTSRTY